MFVLRERRCHGIPVAFVIKGIAKQHVVFQRCILNPSLLWHIRNRPLHKKINEVKKIYVRIWLGCIGEKMLYCIIVWVNYGHLLRIIVIGNDQGLTCLNSIHPQS